jgi:hypothetical protein
MPTLAAMIAPIGALHLATPTTPDGIASAPPRDAQPPEETGAPAMNRGPIPTMTGADGIARLIEMITPPTTAVPVVTTEVVAVVILVELRVDMMSGVNACRLVARSRKYGLRRGVAQPTSVIVSDRAAAQLLTCQDTASEAARAWMSFEPEGFGSRVRRMKNPKRRVVSPPAKRFW